MIVAQCESCRALYTADMWKRVRVVDERFIPATIDEPARLAEVRQCICGAAMVRHPNHDLVGQMRLADAIGDVDTAMALLAEAERRGRERYFWRIVR